MDRNKKPADIHFFEEESLSNGPAFGSKLTRVVRTLSFGLIKNDTQAGFFVLLLLAVLGGMTYYFLQSNRTIEPTVHYELLPQESIGSLQGLPPEPTYE